MSNEDLENFFEQLLPVARKKLREDAGFIPFAAARPEEGSITYAGPDSLPDYPEPPDTLPFLIEGLRKQARCRDLIAAAIIGPVQVTPPDDRDELDAVQFRLEHRSRSAIKRYVPFQKTRNDTGRIENPSWFDLEAPSEIFRNQP